MNHNLKDLSINGNQASILNQIQSMLQNYEAKDTKPIAEKPNSPQNVIAQNNGSNDPCYVNQQPTQYPVCHMENSAVIPNHVQPISGVKEAQEVKNQPINVEKQDPENGSQNVRTDSAAGPPILEQQEAGKSEAIEAIPANLEQNYNPEIVDSQLNEIVVKSVESQIAGYSSSPDAELQNQRGLQGLELVKQLQDGSINFSQFISEFVCLIPIQQEKQANQQKGEIDNKYKNQQDKINQILTHNEQGSNDIYQNMTHEKISNNDTDKINNQINLDQNQNMHYIPNFEKTSQNANDKQSDCRQSEKMDTDKARHTSQSSRHHGAIMNKNLNQTFFEDLFPQVNTFQKTRQQNQIQFLNKVIGRTQRSQLTQQMIETQNASPEQNLKPHSVPRNVSANESIALNQNVTLTNQRSGSLDQNQQSQMLYNIKMQNQNDFQKMQRGIQNQMSIQMQQNSQMMNKQEKNKSKDSRQSKQSKKSKVSNKTKMSGVSEGQNSTNLRFQQQRQRKRFDNDSQSHDEAQAEQPSKKFQGNSWIPSCKKKQNSSNQIVNDVINPQVQEIMANGNPSGNQKLSSSTQNDLQSILMELLIQKIKQEIQINNHNQSIGTDTSGIQGTCFTDDKNAQKSLDLHGSSGSQELLSKRQETNIMFKNPKMIQRVEEKANDIQQLILNQLKEKAKQLQDSQFIQEDEQIVQKHNDQKNSSTISEKNSHKDDTAKFAANSQLNNPENPPHESSGQVLTLTEELKPKTTEDKLTNTESAMSKEGKNIQNATKSGLSISQINLENFPNLPESIRTLIQNKQNIEKQMQKNSEKSNINYNSGSGSGKGSGSTDKDESNGLDINQLHKLIENYIPPKAQEIPQQQQFLQQNGQNQVSNQNSAIYQQPSNESGPQNKFAQAIRQHMNQAPNQYQQLNTGMVPAEQPQRMRYNGPTSSSGGSGEDQNRNVNNTVNINQTKAMTPLTQNNLLSMQNDLKIMLSNLQQGTQQQSAMNKMPVVSQTQNQQLLLGKRTMNERTDAQDSNLLQQKLQLPMNLIQQIQNACQANSKPSFNQDPQKLVANDSVVNPRDDQITKQDASLEENEEQDNDTPMQIRLRNQIRNNQSMIQFRQVKIELLKAIRSEKDQSKTIIDAKPKRPHHNMGGNMFRGSQYRGVSKNKNKWQMMIMINQKKVYIGAIQNEFDAARYYDHIAIISQGLSAKTNFRYSAAKVKGIIKDYDIDNDEEQLPVENYPSGYQSISSNDNNLLQQISIFKNQKIEQDQNPQQQLMSNQLQSMFRPNNNVVQSQLQQLLSLQNQNKANMLPLAQHNPHLLVQNQILPQQSLILEQNEQLKKLQMLVDNQTKQNQINHLQSVSPVQQGTSLQLQNFMESLIKNNAMRNSEANTNEQNLVQILQNKNVTPESWQTIQNHARKFPLQGNNQEFAANQFNNNAGAQDLSLKKEIQGPRRDNI